MCTVAALVALCACSAQSTETATDPIPDVPTEQQRTVRRGAFDRWPLSVGTGTLGCTSGAVLFRSAGVTYAVNDAARSRRYADIASIQLTTSSAPTNPLKRVRQDDRMRIFAEATACEHPGAARSASPEQCRARLLHTSQLSNSELQQIRAEGQERRWAPLLPDLADLSPLVEAGMRLCRAR